MRLDEIFGFDKKKVKSPEQKYKVGQWAVYDMSPPQRDGYGEGKIKSYADGFYAINNKTVRQNDIIRVDDDQTHMTSDVTHDSIRYKEIKRDRPSAFESRTSIDEIFGFGKKKVEPKRADITADDREMIKSVFPKYHNADLKYTTRYVLPDSVLAIYKNVRITFFKYGEQLKCNVAWYADEDGPGDPRKSALIHEKSDRNINSKADLEKIKNEVDGKPVDEGWKSNVAGAALVGAAALGISMSPKADVNGTKYDLATATAPSNAKSAVAEINGKKVKVKIWTATGPKNQTTKVYKPE